MFRDEIAFMQNKWMFLVASCELRGNKNVGYITKTSRLTIWHWMLTLIYTVILRFVFIHVCIGFVFNLWLHEWCGVHWATWNWWYSFCWAKMCTWAVFNCIINCCLEMCENVSLLCQCRCYFSVITPIKGTKKKGRKNILFIRITFSRFIDWMKEETDKK